MMRHLALFLLVALGCAGCRYRAGDDAETPFHTISIEAVKNDSFAPQVQAEMHRQLHDALASEKPLHVVDSGGRARLTVRLVDYRRSVGAVNPDDTVLAASHIFSLSARITLIDSATGKKLINERLVTSSLSAYAPTGVNRTEMMTQGLLLRELARDIRSAVTNVW